MPFNPHGDDAMASSMWGKLIEKLDPCCFGISVGSRAGGITKGFPRPQLHRECPQNHSASGGLRPVDGPTDFSTLGHVDVPCFESVVGGIAASQRRQSRVSRGASLTYMESLLNNPPGFTPDAEPGKPDFNL